MTSTLTKEVIFNSDKLIAIQNEKGIYTIVKTVCKNLDLSEGQTNRQMLNIQADLVLNQGVSNLVYLTKGGNQVVLCILIDFLPLWLAKISIISTMKKKH